MTTYLDQILDPILLGEMIDQGYVQARHHPKFPYAIYCYTKQAMFDREWNRVTKICRGLIVNEETSEIMARPFSKFFNYGEPDAPAFQPDDWVTVWDKLDGSLGIAYDTPDGPAIATKGSFTSEQAIHATELLRTNYPLYQVDDYCTDLFEIIYPENRIVLDYGDLDALWYLGSVAINDGDPYWNGITIGHYNIPKNHFLVQCEFKDVFDNIDLNRPNREGVVIFNDYTGERLKVKQEDYLELHKVMTGLNERQLWEWLSEGKMRSDILKDLPEELHGWATPILDKMLEDFGNVTSRTWDAFMFHKANMTSRKDFAERIAQYPPLDKGVMFLLLDGQAARADQLVWKALRP